MMKNMIETIWEKKVRKQNKEVIKEIEEVKETMNDVRTLTDRLKHKEEELRVQRDKYAKMYSMMGCLIDAIPDIVWAKDLDGNFILTNQKLRDDFLMGATIDESLQGSPESFAEKAYEGGKLFTLDLDCKRTDKIVLAKKKAGVFIERGKVDGVDKAYRTHKAPLVDRETGEITGTVGTGRDVTSEYNDALFILNKVKGVIETCPQMCSVNEKQIATLDEVVVFLENMIKDCKIYGEEYGR